MRIIQDPLVYRQLRSEMSGRVGFVPTMGALHEGHLSLVRLCREQCDHVVVSIYVNPLQFGPKEDFSSYPRDLGQDVALLEAENVDVLFSPISLAEKGAETTIEPGGLASKWCGKDRPIFFAGVLTVVSKLFNIIQPTDAWFGQKDYQQFCVIQKWVEDQFVPIQLHCGPIVREKNGLAMSSRNKYLNLEEKQIAPNIYKSLMAAKSEYLKGQKSGQKIMEIAKEYLRGIKIDYFAIVDSKTLEPISDVFEGAVLILAVKLGRTRLIDNMVFAHSPKG